MMFINPFSFEGRIRRLEYGISCTIFYFFIAILKGIAAQINSTFGMLIIFVIITPLALFYWAQGAKRCHDIGKSGWYQFIPFFIFWMLFKNGIKETNEYGINPKFEKI